MIRHLRSLMNAGQEIINAVGIRAAESPSRAQMSEWEWQEGFDCEVWRPVLRWTMQDVVAIHARHGLKPNPLYLMGATRVGCWPCIYARKSEIRLIAETDLQRITRLRVLESDVSDAAQQRAERDGKLLKTPPAWFQCRTRERSADGSRSGACWPIDRVVQWSRSAPRGVGPARDEFLFGAQQDGCMRWGMCDTAAESEQGEEDTPNRAPTAE
jgi:3'-phosphoadenosine 5'-phosphosulfate sulfotransferase (PAPS reductase)/FAD synthetase